MIKSKVKYYLRWTIVICFLSYVKTYGNIISILDSKPLYTNDSTFRFFPFDELVGEFPLSDIAAISEVHQALEDRDYDGDLFFKSFLKIYLKSVDLSFNHSAKFNELLSLGEIYFFAAKFFPEYRGLYNNLSDKIFSSLSHSIKNGIERAYLNRYDFETIYWLKSLEHYQYNIDFEIKLFDKGMHHLSIGNYSYVTSRIWIKYKLLIAVFATLLLVLFSTVIHSFINRRSSKKNIEY